MDPVEPASDVAAAEDRALMARLQHGDEAALAPLMERWEVPVKAVIGRLVLNASEAEDLAQETFVRVWQQRHRYRPGAEFRPWVFAIAVNLARNRLRWWRRRPVTSLDAWTEVLGGAGQRQPNALAIDASVGAAEMERVERAGAVQHAVAQLPAQLREALVLFEYDQMSQADIAAVVGTTAKAVEARIYRARERLRSALRNLR